MQVIFQTKSKNQNRYSIGNVPGFGRVFFSKGVKITTDKDLIKALMKSKLYERGDYKMVTNEEMVANYLEGVEPDKITRKMLDKLSIEGIKELGKVVKAKSEQPALIKVEAEGKPITSNVQLILDEYQVSSKVQEPVSEPKEFVAKVSTDMKAGEAVEYIIATPASNLTGFLAKDEERKTVLNAWNDKFGE